MKALLAALLVTTLALAGCDQSVPASADGTQPQAQPSNNGWLWGLGGYLMGRAMAPSPSVASSPVIINRTTIIKQAPPAPKPPVVKPSPPAVRPSMPSRSLTPSRSYSAPRSFSGGRR